MKLSFVEQVRLNILYEQSTQCFDTLISSISLGRNVVPLFIDVLLLHYGISTSSHPISKLNTALLSDSSLTQSTILVDA